MPALLPSNLDGTAIKSLIIFTVVFVLSSAALLLARKLLLGLLHRWAKKTETRADDIFVGAFSHPSLYWALAIGLYIALDTSEFPQKYVGWGLSAIYAITVFSITIAIANIGVRLFEDSIRKAGMDVHATGLTRAVIKGVVYGVGVLMILNGLGVSVAPILTALGVGGLAVALALQDTLSNVFSGIHLMIEKSVKVGDYIKLGSGEEGFVADIGWRTTKVRQTANNMVIIPNNKLAQSILTNFHLPQKLTAIFVDVGVSYSSDPERVERILIEEASAPGIKGLLPEPPPTVRFTRFGSSSMDFTLVCHIEELVKDQYEVQNELRKRILKRFRQEGIEIPFPVTTVHLKQ